MKQILQNLSNGVTEITEVPCPLAKRGQLLIRTRRTLVSTGTERILLEFGKASLLEKARQQPDKVRMVLDKLRTDGLLSTIDVVRNKLDQPLPLGYCNAGVVVEVGEGVTGFKVGDRVASNGRHAEMVCVPSNLCAKIPDAVSDDTAAFTVLGAIALQGIRLALPTLGEAFGVIGLGLVGLMIVQLLRAQGCRVLGMDFDRTRLELARQFGAETVDLGAGGDSEAAAMSFSMGRGVDGALIAASTQSSDPVRQAARMCRKRGRIILVGVTGLELSRADFYEKELTFQVSCSYGPGRYDPEYEEKGHDYPLGFVRWTEQRNFEAVLDMMADGRLDVKSLISHRFRIDEAKQAYELVGGSASSLGILLEYPAPEGRPESLLPNRTVRLNAAKPIAGKVTVAFIGSGNYATAVLIPAFKAAGARLKTVVSAGGVSGVHAGRKYGFEETTTTTDAVFADPEVNAVVITTRHDSHAKLVCQSLAAGKHVFVEKPLAIRPEEITAIEEANKASRASNGWAPILMVGFNRRFAPHIVKIKALLQSVHEPKCFVMTVNAGEIRAEHWTQDPEVGGGRIIGEGCHFIDLLRFLAGAPSVSVQALMLGAGNGVREDKVSVTLAFADGSIGTVHYFSNGHRSFSKERLEVFCGGRVLQLDNFRKLKGFGWTGFHKLNLWRQDKGNQNCSKAFVTALESGKASPIPFDELLEVSRAGFEIVQSLHGQR